MLRLESGAAFIFMGLQGFLNAVLLRLEMGENAAGGSAAVMLATVFLRGGVTLPVAGVAERMSRPRWGRKRAPIYHITFTF